MTMLNAEAYRSQVLGGELSFVLRAGLNVLNHPAFVKTGKIIDTGVTVQVAGTPATYHFDCRTSINVLTCKNRVLFTKSFGYWKSGTRETGIFGNYEEMKEIVYRANPCSQSLIDVRTTRQLEKGCCPYEMENITPDEMHELYKALG